MACINHIVWSLIFALSSSIPTEETRKPTDCPELTFGLRCEHQCHCPVGDGCDSINGLCNSGHCHQHWTGAGCQIRHPVMREPPVVASSLTSCAFTISWSSWSTQRDIGHGPVAQYLLQVCDGVGQWTDVRHLLSTRANRYSAVYVVPPYREHLAHKFRIVLYREDDGKLIRSIPGPESEAAKPRCLSQSTTTLSVPPTRPSIQGRLLRDVEDLTIDWKSLPTPLLKPATLQLTTDNKVRILLQPKALTEISGSVWVTLTPVKSYGKAFTPRHTVVEVTAAYEADLGQLRPATYYRLELTSTEPPSTPMEGYFWTAPFKPPAPRPPTIVNSTDSTLTAAIYPLTDDQLKETSPISAYHVIVERPDGGARRRRQAPPVDELLPYDNATDVYVAVELPGDVAADDADELLVVIGDGSTYGHYRNVPLAPDTDYRIWLVVSSTLGALTRRTFVPTSGAVRTRASGEVGSSAAGRRLTPAIVALIACASLLAVGLFLAVVVVLCTSGCCGCCRRRWRRGEFRLHRCHASVALPFADGVKPSASSASSENAETVCKASLPNVSKALDDGGAIHVNNLHRFLDADESTEARLVAEFRSLPKGLLGSVGVATLPENAELNRSLEVVPYDRNRVRLASAGSSYINASHVGWPDGGATYIVTQAPMTVSMAAFWATVWQHDVGVVVMLMELAEPGKPRCSPYWPEDGSRVYGDVSVRLCQTDVTAHYVVRELSLRHVGADVDRPVTHFQFTSWRAGGTPPHAIPFVDFVCRIQDERAGHVTRLVHCHAGGGRSGMFVAVDCLLREARRSAAVDVRRCVAGLRRQRSNLVKTFRQYRFVYRCLAELYDNPGSRIPAEHFPVAYQLLVDDSTSGGATILTKEYNKLCLRRLARGRQRSDRTATPAGRLRSFVRSASFSPARPARSPRLNSTLILDRSLPPASQSAGEPTSVDSWRSLDSFRRKNAFVVRSHPPADDLDEFWNFVIAYDVRGIVDVSYNHTPVPRYFPGEDASLHGGRLKLDVVSQTSVDPLTSLTEVTLSRLDGRCLGQALVRKTIRVLQWSGWPGDRVVPSPDHMLSLLRSARSPTMSGSGVCCPIVVLASDVDRASFFCLVWTMCERVEAEWLVDVYMSAKYAEQFLPAVVSSQEHYKYLYTVMKEKIRRINQLGSTAPDISSGHTSSGHASPGSTLPRHTSPGNTSPGFTSPGFTSPGFTSPGHTSPGFTSPGHISPGFTSPGHTSPGFTSPGHISPGYSSLRVTIEERMTQRNVHAQPQHDPESASAK